MTYRPDFDADFKEIDPEIAKKYRDTMNELCTMFNSKGLTIQDGLIVLLSSLGLVIANLQVSPENKEALMDGMFKQLRKTVLYRY